MIAVVKVGSSSVTARRCSGCAGSSRRPRERPHRRRRLVGRHCRRLGRARRGSQRPSDPAVLQAVSAVGQHRLMRLWQDGFEPMASWRPGTPGAARLRPPHPVPACAGHVRHLVDLGVVPVVNENDAVADEEIRFGDNDRLAALVAHLVGAQLLVLLTDTPGLLTADPRRDDEASLIEEVVEIDQELERWPAVPAPRGQRRHGLQAGRGQDRHLVGRADGDRRCPPPRSAGGSPGRRARRRHGVPRSQTGCRPASSGSLSRSDRAVA